MPYRIKVWIPFRKVCAYSLDTVSLRESIRSTWECLVITQRMHYVADIDMSILFKQQASKDFIPELVIMVGTEFSSNYEMIGVRHNTELRIKPKNAAWSSFKICRNIFV